MSVKIKTACLSLSRTTWSEWTPSVSVQRSSFSVLRNRINPSFCWAARTRGQPETSGPWSDSSANTATRSSSVARTTMATLSRWKWSTTWSIWSRPVTTAPSTSSIAVSVNMLSGASLWRTTRCQFSLGMTSFSLQGRSAVPRTGNVFVLSIASQFQHCSYNKIDAKQASDHGHRLSSF